MTRQAILDAAHEMFDARGFDNVTVAEIADAANISAKTVFAHFPSKEDLVFDDEEELRDSVLCSLRQRAPGQSPLQALVTLLSEMVPETVSETITHLSRLLGPVASSTTLKSRLRLFWDQLEHDVAEQLAEELGERADSPRPRIAAAQLVLVFRMLASEEHLGYLRANPRQSSRDVWLEAMVDLVGGGIADYPASRPSMRACRPTG
ncbi:TetR/AcrR family transcriptional regulator [Pseudonocardia spinosispora]|uniref:TetR/AcrR family transcriptional regulator n=1 Tax=Pseudonocardia spinosispora TaxID=103441 RepID=UPI0003FF5399|nr:TetR/AcrR family transcriptional regulator [Pseudonocardia spinosispora]